jgi:hypothetical protein
MNTNIRNILREGLIVEASKKQILIQKVGWDEESAEILDRLCGPLSVFIGNKIIEQKILEYGKFPDEVTQQQKVKMVLGELIDNRYVYKQRQNITSIMDWIRVGLNGNLGEYKTMPYYQLYNASVKWHDELEVGQGDINYVEDNPIILDFRGADGLGFYWADLETNNSPEECDRMGHCGRSGYGNLYSLRQVIRLNDKYTLNKSILTAAIGEDGIMYQLKGGKNSKPEDKYHPYILPLFDLKKEDGEFFISGFGSEYDAARDFKLTDLGDDVIRKLFAERPELFNKRGLKKKLFKMGLIDKLPDEYISIEIDPDMIDRYVDGDYKVGSRTNKYGNKEDIGLFETILAGDTWDLWDNYDVDWKAALQYHADTSSEQMIDEKLRAIAAKKGVEYDDEMSLEDKIEEYDDDEEIQRAISYAVNDAESDSYVNDLYKKLKEALEELGGVERMDDSGVVLRIDMGKYLDELEDDVYEEIADRCNDDLSCMFDEMIGEWIDKPDFRFDDRYYHPDVDDNYFNELLQERLDEIRIDESKVMIKNMLRENFVPNVVNEISKEVYTRIKALYPKARLIMSHEPEISFKEKPNQELEFKPNGLWYGIGTAWIDYVRDVFPHREQEHMFKINVDESQMKIIRTLEELVEFEKEYGVKDGYYTYIDYVRVAQDYGGIEIAPYLGKAYGTHMWYNGWDVPSGCIWRSGVITKIVRIS